MNIPSTIAWLIDEASATPTADRFLTELGSRLVADGLPLAGGALTLSAPHPIIRHRTWLWTARTGAVIEAVDFAALGEANACLLYTSPSPRDRQKSRMPSSA